MAITVIFMWIFVAAQVFFEYRHQHGHTGPYVGITKTIGSILFVVAAILGSVHEQAGGWFLAAGIILCVAGDVFLISARRQFFLMGLASFLLAHIAYCLGFTQMNADIVVIAVAAPLTLMAGIFIARWILPHLDAGMKKPVIAYLVTICTMVTLSAGVLFEGGAHFTIAALVFMISDLFVARDRFVKSTFQNRLFGLPLYYGAQLMFATSITIAPFFNSI